MTDKLGFFATVQADLQSYADFNEMPLKSVMHYIDVLMRPGPMAVILFRMTTFCHQAGLRPISRILYIMNTVIFGASLPPAAQVGPGLVIPHPVGMGFAGPCKIGKNVRLFGGVILGAAGYEDRSADGFPTVGDGCFIFSRAQVMGPVEIGDDAIIGVNAVVTKSIPAGAIALGAPARVVRWRAGYGPPTPSPAAAGEGGGEGPP